MGRKYMDENSHLTPRNPISSGHGKPVKKNQLYNCENVWDNSCKIIGWITQKILGNAVCFDHQPLLYNPMISKQGKMITEDDLPEFDFGDKLDVRSLKENRIEIFGGEDELTKKLTRKIFLKLNLSPVRNFPECDDRRCRPPMHEIIFRKKFLRDIIRSAFFNDNVDTGSKVKASISAYLGRTMNQQNIKNHLKMSNPRNNFLLNDRCTLLRMKIRFKIFYTKLDLSRMKIEDIKDGNCMYCIDLEDSPKTESLRHILLDCKTLQIVWKHFRKEIFSNWKIGFLYLEMVNGPISNDPGKLQSEYVFLRIINRFTGIRTKEGFDAVLNEKLIKTCDDAIRVVKKIFTKNLRISLGEAMN